MYQISQLSYLMSTIVYNSWTYILNEFGGWTGQSEVELPNEQQGVGLTETDGWMDRSPLSAVLTESRKWWFTRWAFIHALSQMNKDQIRGLWAPLSILTFIWALGSARCDLCLQQRRKEKKNKKTNEVAWNHILMLCQTAALTLRGMMGDKAERWRVTGKEDGGSSPVTFNADEM